MGKPLAQHLRNANWTMCLPAKKKENSCKHYAAEWPHDGQHSLHSVSSSRTEDFVQHTECSTTAPSSPGWRGIVAMIAGVMQQTLCWGMIMTFGSILTFYSSHLLPHTTDTAISFVGVLPSFFVFGSSLFWGRLLDAGHHRKVNTFAGICLTAGLTGLAFTGGDGNYGDGKYWQILLASVPIGIGQSAYFLTAPHVAKTWIPHRKGLAMGITNSGTAVGGIIWPLIFTRVTASYSFKAGIGALACISALFGCFIVYASIPGPSFERRKLENCSYFRTWVPTPAFRSTTMMVHVAAMCCMYSSMLTIPFFIEYWAQQRGIGVSEDIVAGVGLTNPDGPKTVYLVVIMNACQFPGRLMGSSLCDRLQARKLHAIFCILAVIVIGPAWLKATTYTQGCVFAAFFGLTLGVIASLPVNDAADILGPHRVRIFGQYTGFVYTAVSPFLLGGAVISGVLADHLHSNAVGLWAISCFAASAVLITLSLVLPDDTWKLDGNRERLCSGESSLPDEKEIENRRTYRSSNEGRPLEV